MHGKVHDWRGLVSKEKATVKGINNLVCENLASHGVIPQLFQTAIFIGPYDLLLLFSVGALLLMYHLLFRSPITDRAWKATGFLLPPCSRF